MTPEQAMARALELARIPDGATHPNPMVGAVVVAGGEIVGEGYHHRAGEPHAEVLALQAAGTGAQGATLYVTLEPCNHHGRTPPCTRAILAAGISRVVAGTLDPNPTVEGGGLAWLEAHGVHVSHGLMEEACRDLNRDWLHYVRTGLPFVAVKVAVTLDGYLATSTGDSRWISSDQSRRRVMEMRSRADAVLVGTGTLLADDPRLTARLPDARQPTRMALDPQLQCPLDARLLQPGAETVLFAGPDASAQRERALVEAGAEVIRVPEVEPGRLDLHEVLREAGRLGVVQLLVEGGGTLVRDLLDRDLVQELRVFVAPRILGGSDGLPLAGRGAGVPTVAQAWGLEQARWEIVGHDALVIGRPVRGDRRTGGS